MGSKLENMIASAIINHMISNDLDAFAYDHTAIIDEMTRNGAKFNDCGQLVVIVDSTFGEVIESHRK